MRFIQYRGIKRGNKKEKQYNQEKFVIVESPAKAKTIEKYLGRNYKVMASVGHIRDLKKSTMSIDFDNNYEPTSISIFVEKVFDQ